MRELLIILLLFTASSIAQNADSPASRAERIYKGKCANCHSVDGSGSSPLGKKLQLRDLRSATVQSRTDAQLLDIIRKGRSGMPSFDRQFDVEDLNAVVRYLRSLSHTQPASSATR